MLEYEIYLSHDKVLINPNHITTVICHGNNKTKISTTDGNTFVVNSPYEEVKKDIRSYAWKELEV